MYLRVNKLNLDIFIHVPHLKLSTRFLSSSSRQTEITHSSVSKHFIFKKERKCYWIDIKDIASIP